MQKSLVKNSIYNIIYTSANILFPFLTSIYISRLLLPNGVGKVAYAQNIASYFLSFAALGLPSYGVREFAKIREDKDKRNKLFTELFLINLISTTFAVLGFFILLFINNAFNNEWKLYIACGLVVFFNYLNIDWLYQGMEEYGYITGRSILIKVLSFICVVLLVRSQFDYVIYALISSLATVGNYLFNIFHARRIVKFDFRNLDIKKHLKPVLLIAVVVFLSGIYSKIDTTMLGMMTTPESVGYYTYAQKTVNIVITLAAAVTAALLPRLSFYYDKDRDNFFVLLDKGFRVLCLTAIPLCAGLYLIADQAVRILYGNAFLPTILTIRLMCPLILIKGFGDLFCYQLVYSTRNEKILVPASILASTINISMNAVLIPIFLQNGAVVASVFSELVTNIVQYIYIKKRVAFKLNMKALKQSFLTTGIMIFCILIVSQFDIPNFAMFFIKLILGGSAFVIGNLFLKNEIIVEALERIKKFVTRHNKNIV